MSKTAVITGANRGIGLALARNLKARGYDIVGVCRTASAELEMVTSDIVDNTDLTNAADVARLAEHLQGRSIDVLINNAGAMADHVLGDIDYNSMQQLMTVNAFAPLHVTEALLDNLNEGSKVILVTSRMGSIADNDSGGRYGYRASKAALNAIGKSLAVDLKSQGIAVALLHPGYVQTRMVGFGGHITPDEAAAGMADRIAELDLGNTGTFWHSNGEILPW